LLELNGFKSTKNKNSLEVITEIEKMGGVIQCVSTRENIIYCMDVLKENAEPAFQIFADTILNPTYPEEELNESRMIVELQQFELPSEVFSRDLVQRAGYQGYPLGNHQYCPLESVLNINASHLQQFRDQFYFGENMVVGAAGIEHNELVRISEKYLSSIPKHPKSSLILPNNNTSNSNSSNNNNSKELIQRPKSKYTGGLLTHQRELKEPFVKIAMAFEIGGWKDKQLIAASVLQQLLGGGSSFSAGGPGKGMYSRLYTQVLNRHHWAESVESFLSVHEDHGLLGIDGACPPHNLPHMIKAITEQFVNVAVWGLKTEELNRAKNMLKSMMMMQLESRLVICEDISRQIITFGYREDPIELCKKIDAITSKDVMAVAQNMLQQPPSIGVVGMDVSHMPPYEDVKRFVGDVYHSVWKSST
jgi:processing peptidase subunit alpha